MIKVDVNFVHEWSAKTRRECNEWLDKYPRFNDIYVDDKTGMMHFDNEQDAVFFILRWL